MQQGERVGFAGELTLPSVVVQVFWVLLFALGTAAGARLEIPHTPVPYTLQTLVVILSGAFLGARNGFLSQAAYIALGASGAPFFAGGASGVAVLAGPTGGYLLAFPFAAALVGALTAHRHTLTRTALAMAAGLVVIFSLGAVQLALLTTHRFSTALDAGVLIFSWWDGLKLCAASMIYHEAGKRWRRLPL
ncbi:MAG TPA: biotin transporter BioY [Bacteroidota bacterium]|nr:biotin transporter BioY [Bacteroidota bacterium]